MAIGRKSGLSTNSEDESGRDSRLMLLLLAFALVLVAVYASWMTGMGGLVRAWIVGLFESPLPLAGAAAAILVLGGAVVMLRRRRRQAKAKAKPAKPVEAPVNRVSRDEFVRTLGTQVEAHEKSGRQLAVHLIDIDRFRKVNEILGEAEGDAFLRLVTERLLVLVNQPDRLARVGDDEFAVIQPEVGGVRHAEIYARRIQETLKDACAQVPRHARPGASIGIAVYPDHGDDTGEAYHCAALALHAAKTAGGGDFAIYQRELEMEITARLEMEKAVSDGLHQGWYELHYQPQYDLVTRRLTGFEALVRMSHPDLGSLAPASFLPVAEESGLIQPLGEWIARDALTTAADWPEHIALSVNVAAEQLLHGDFAGSIVNMLSQTGVDGARLRLEISESLLLAQSSAVEEQLQRLRSRGIAIVLDDFGLDRSRLQSLARTACDAVKIDRTLVERLGEEPEAENVVRSLIATARAFDLEVVAEGIERPEQARFLLSHDCRNVQGFLFGRPVPASDLGAIIAKDMRKGSEEEARAPAKPRTAA